MPWLYFQNIGCTIFPSTGDFGEPISRSCLFLHLKPHTQTLGGVLNEPEPWSRIVFNLVGIWVPPYFPQKSDISPTLHVSCCLSSIFHWRTPTHAYKLSHPAVIVTFDHPSVLHSTAVRPAIIPIISNLVNDCSSGLKFAGDTPFWIWSHIIHTVSIASLYPEDPCRFWLNHRRTWFPCCWRYVAVMKCSKWSASGHWVYPQIHRWRGEGLHCMRGVGGWSMRISPTIRNFSPSCTSSGLRCVYVSLAGKSG